jgi:hypothetical protein
VAQVNVTMPEYEFINIAIPGTEYYVIVAPFTTVGYGYASRWDFGEFIPGKNPGRGEGRVGRGREKARKRTLR